MTLLTITLLALVATMAQGLVLTFLGVAGSFISQAIKKYVGTEGNKALSIVIAVSVALAVGFTWFTGELTSGGVFTGASVVFSIATLVYKWIISSWDTTSDTNQDALI